MGEQNEYQIFTTLHPNAAFEVNVYSHQWRHIYRGFENTLSEAIESDEAAIERSKRLRAACEQFGIDEMPPMEVPW